MAESRSPGKPESASAQAAFGVAAGGALLLVCVLSWPRWSFAPDVGLDFSWILGLSWAADLGLRWGRDLIFTYGPLGYTLAPMAFSPAQIAVASVLVVCGSGATLWFAFAGARRHPALSRPTALALAALGSAVALATSPPGIFLSPPVFVAVLAGSALRFASRKDQHLVWVGLLLGILGHQKLSEAVLALGFSTLCAFGARGLGGVARLAAMTALSWVAVWIGTGHSLIDLPGWVRDAAELSLGYSDAMSASMPEAMWHHVAAAVLVTLVIAQAWLVSTGRPAPERSALLLATLFAAWMGWKGGFTRHDAHALIFTSTLLVLALALLPLAQGRRALGVSCVVAACAFATHGAIDRHFGGSYLDPLERAERVRAFANTGSALYDDHRRGILEAASQELRGRYRITPTLARSIAAGPTSADPWDISALWAADAEWAPLPVFQIYHAYTPSLDAANARALGDTPRQILRTRVYRSIDGRRGSWDSPLYQSAIYCGYALREQHGPWLLLEPRTTALCAEPERVETRVVSAGEEVAIPRGSGTQTLVTIEPRRGLGAGVQSFVAKSPPLSITEIAAGGVRRWRYAHGDRATRLMLNAPVPHPAFADLGREPPLALQLDVDAEVSFELRSVRH